MSVHIDPKSPFYHYAFKIGGHRFRGSTKTGNKREAEAVERQLKAEKRAELEKMKVTGTGPLLLRHAAGKYWDEVGQYHACSADTYRDLARLIAFFGADKRLDQIDHSAAAAMVSWRREHTIRGQKKDKHGKPVPKISPSTVNRSSTMVLKKLFTHAKANGKRSFPDEPNWKKLWLEEPSARVRELSESEADALDASVRDDYADWFDFARITGRRRKETLITWAAVNFTSGQIRTKGKRGRAVVTPITDELLAILERQRGHHDEFVFTYVAQSTREGRIRGTRYPLTEAGAKTQWRRLVKKAGVSDFRFHDVRHDVAMKTLRFTGNIRLVQKVMNHSNVRTTERYADVLDNDVREAMSGVARGRKKGLTTSDAMAQAIEIK